MYPEMGSNRNLDTSGSGSGCGLGGGGGLGVDAGGGAGAGVTSSAGKSTSSSFGVLTSTSSVTCSGSFSFSSPTVLTTSSFFSVVSEHVWLFCLLSGKLGTHNVYTYIPVPNSFVRWGTRPGLNFSTSPP